MIIDKLHGNQFQVNEKNLAVNEPSQSQQMKAWSEVDALEKSVGESVKIKTNTAETASIDSIKQAKLKMEMAEDIADYAEVFVNFYPPKEWKEKTRNWNITKELAKAHAEIAATPDITIKDYHGILRRFVNAIGDYHVSARFYSTESSFLPFVVRGSEKRVFIAYVDRFEKPKDFPFEVGDELVSFNGRPVNEVLDELQKQVGENVPETDRMLTELTLTKRSGRKGLKIPDGEVEIGVRKKGSQEVTTYTMEWINKKDELYKTSTALQANNNFQHKLIHTGMPVARTKQEKTLMKIADFLIPTMGKMISPEWESVGVSEVMNPFGLGSKKSFLPPLGEVTWKSNARLPLDAYIFKTPKGQKVGYVRIPHYMGGQIEMIQWQRLMKKFQAKTDGLVIDQVNNPGGSVGYLVLLASMLTDKPLYMPRHRMSLTPEDVDSANQMLNQIKDLKAQGIPQWMLEALQDKSLFVKEEWERLKDSDKKITKPYHLGFGGYVNPMSNAPFTKPIFVVTNECDFSGGDFFPAIMQDNKRAIIIGARTAGAGGYVLMAENSPNKFGVEGISYTASMAERIDESILESDGVTPDIPLQVTADDFQNNFETFKNSLVNTVELALMASKLQAKLASVQGGN